MKKYLLTLALFAGIISGTMVFSSFTTPKHVCSLIEMNANNWKKFREKVPYCDAEHDVCMGYGTVWVNTETYQIAFEDDKTSDKYDLSEYNGKKGYNMRFWRGWDKAYYYVNIYVPKSAFE